MGPQGGRPISLAPVETWPLTGFAPVRRAWLGWTSGPAEKLKGEACPAPNLSAGPLRPQQGLSACVVRGSTKYMGADVVKGADTPAFT